MSKIKDISITIVYSSSDPFCILGRVALEGFKRCTEANITIAEKTFKDEKGGDARPRMYINCDQGEHGLKVTGITNIFNLLQRLTTEGTPGL